MSESATTIPAEVYESVAEASDSVLVGHDDVLKQLCIALFTRGHVLMEGVPGVAKTTLANLFARTSGLSFTRIQMTPDMLPADITGTQVYREDTGEFHLHRGPVFSSVVVADEINRATPKTQSALLEAMQEGNVTIEGETLDLPDPFMVIATQNPLEFEGVYELPEAQRDRFQQKLRMGLPERQNERRLLERFHENPLLGPEDVDSVIDSELIQRARAAVENVHVAAEITEYQLDIVAASRDHPDIKHGVSPRATLALQNVSKANAAIAGREYVIPDDVKGLAGSVLTHRLVMTTDADVSGVTPDDVISDILASIDPPGSDPTKLASSGAPPG